MTPAPSRSGPPENVELAEVSPAASQAIVNVTPGEPTAFTVTAVLEDEEATSDPSNAVTTTARPGAPTVSGTASYQGDGAVERFVVELSWTEPAANGKAILGYDVSVNVGGVSKSSHTERRYPQRLLHLDLRPCREPGVPGRRRLHRHRDGHQRPRAGRARRAVRRRSDPAPAAAAGR